MLSYPLTVTFKRKRYFVVSTCLQIDDSGGRRYTYSQLVEHVHSCATSLSLLGLRLGQRVCILLSNCIELPVAFLAVQHVGAICVPVNPAASKCTPGWLS